MAFRRFSRKRKIVLWTSKPGGGLVIEIERAGPLRDVGAELAAGLQTVLSTASLASLCDETARLFKRLTGYDRVMVYRFDDEGHGQVFSEEREPHLEAYLGNRYPATDIPQIARQLYMRNRVRVLVDIDYTPVPILAGPAEGGAALDMSLCVLRSMSPIHIQYLKNMGVGATLVASLVVGGALWGLVACHHYQPRELHFEDRAMCEVLAEAVATRAAALESFQQAQAELWVRRIEQRMIEAIARHGDWRLALFDGSNSLLQPVAASGAALLFEDQVLTAGEVPGTAELREIGAWLDRQDWSDAFATASLGSDAPEFAPIIRVASGVLAVRVSSVPGEFLVWFRPERIRTVTWGGNPYKAVVIGDDPADLSPRRSFAQWHQVVEGTSDPWSPADLTAARLIGESITDVVLQFRSLRMLIAQDQLDTVRRQVEVAEQAVLIAGADGRVLSLNAAFARLGGPGAAPVHVADVLALLDDAPEAGRRLDDLLHAGRSWRGEVRMRGDDGEKLLLVRADPVFAAPGRVLGFVMLFTDLADQKAAEQARRHFQDRVVQSGRVLPGRLDTAQDLQYRNLLATLVDNAQLAALEITDGVDMARIPPMLDSLENSVQRAAQLLERLIRHAGES